MSPPSASPAGGGGESLRLTREQILERIRRWHAVYGEPPVTADWNPSVARWRAQEWRIPRYRAGDPETGEPWPSLNAVKRRFDGSFDAAVRLAGLEPRKPGPPRRPHVARPAAAPRPTRPPSHGERLAAELASALLRAREAERALADAEHRGERLEAKLEDARVRARRAGYRARRARAASSRGVSVVETAPVEVDTARIGDAEARAQAAEDREQAAVADAERAREVARRALGAEGAVALSGAELSELRRGAAPAGPAVLAAALTTLARARARGDRGALHAALTDLAGAAVRWRDRL